MNEYLEDFIIFIKNNNIQDLFFYENSLDEGNNTHCCLIKKDLDEKIESLKDDLSKTDYKIIKLVENGGVMSEINTLHNDRQKIREEINKLERLYIIPELKIKNFYDFELLKFLIKNIDSVREEKITQLLLHDSSSDVNTCYISYNNQILPYWANKTERSTLKTAINDCISAGREYYRLDLRDLNVSISIKCSEILMMLTQLEVYAIDCYNVTTDHLIKIKGFETIEEIEAYDFTLGYPEKLTFTINNDIEG